MPQPGPNDCSRHANRRNEPNRLPYEPMMRSLPKTNPAPGERSVNIAPMNEDSLTLCRRPKISSIN